MSNKVILKPNKVAVAVAATLLTTVAVASVIVYDVDVSNMVLNDEETLIYPVVPPAGTHNGYLVVDADEGILAPGIGTYTFNFTTGSTPYNGCIMSSKGATAAEADTCRGEPDSGKRFKLKATQLNEPMDIVFNLTNTGATNRYNVYGKFTNDTGVDATGFVVQIGTGIGANFRELPGVTLVPSSTLVGGVPQLGKYPGGLFGGSPAEGVPYFDTESAPFTGTATSTHTLTTNGMPTQYSVPFGDWLSLANVPEAWFYDIDGRPWTDNKLVAWNDGGVWSAMKKEWDTPPVITVSGELGDVTVDLTTYVQNPLTVEFVDVDALTAELNAAYAGQDFKVQDVVTALLDILTLTKVVVETDAPGTLANYAANPVTVRFDATFAGTDPTPAEAAGWPLVATWDPACGEDGLYRLEVAYVAHPDIAPIATTDATPSACGDVATADDMATVVKDNSGALTDFFAIPGYSQGVIEDLANVNGYYAIDVGANVTGPLTMRVTVSNDPEAVPAPLPPAPPPSSDDGGGCTVGGNGRFDPTLPALAAAGLVFFGLRRFKASK